MTPPYEQTREDINTRKLIERVQEEVRLINATFKPLLTTVERLVEKVGGLGDKISSLDAHREHTLTWGKVIGAGIVVLSLCLGIVWRGVDRAEAARDKVLDAKSAMAEAYGKAQAELVEARKALTEHAIKDAATQTKAKR